MQNTAIPMDRVPIRASKETSGTSATVLTDGAAFRRQFQDSAYPAAAQAPLMDAIARAGVPDPAEGEDEALESAVSLPTGAEPTHVPLSVAPLLSLLSEHPDGEALRLQPAAGNAAQALAATADLSDSSNLATEQAMTQQRPVIAARSDGLAPASTAQSGPMAKILTQSASELALPFVAGDAGGKTGSLRAEMPGGTDGPTSSPTLVSVLAATQAKKPAATGGTSEGFIKPLRVPLGWRDLEGEAKVHDPRSTPGPALQPAEFLRPSSALVQPAPVLMAEQMLSGTATLVGESLPAGFEGGVDGPRLGPVASGPGGTAAPTPLPLAQSSAAQVAQAIATSPSDQLEITLSPEELGRVRIQMHQSDIGLQVLISGERPETLDLLRKNITLLARALSELGYEQASFSFGDQGREQGERPGRSSAGLTMNGESTPQVETAVPVRSTRTSGLDLRF